MESRHLRESEAKETMSTLTAEFHDTLIEEHYWVASRDDLAHWAATAATMWAAFSLPLAFADLVNLGMGVTFFCLLLVRALLACVGFGLARLLRTDSRTIRRHGLITAGCGLIMAGSGVIALMRPAATMLDHLEVGMVILAVLILVPNRIPYAVALSGAASAVWIAVSAAVRDTANAALVAHVMGFAATVAIGWAGALLIGTTRRQAFAEHLASARANERLRTEIVWRERLEMDLVQKANTDPLTKTSNRRHFEEQAHDEFVRCQRTHQPMSVMLLDVDHFKWINDTHGHAAGDEVLRVLSEQLAQHLRRIDVVGRLGGEEFAVLMPGADRQRAEEAAERLRMRIAGLRVELPSGRVRLTVSIGVTECDVWTENLTEVLARADEAMYRAKTSGRDKVMVA